MSMLNINILKLTCVAGSLMLSACQNADKGPWTQNADYQVLARKSKELETRLKSLRSQQGSQASRTYGQGSSAGPSVGSGLGAIIGAAGALSIASKSGGSRIGGAMAGGLFAGVHYPNSASLRDGGRGGRAAIISSQKRQEQDLSARISKTETELQVVELKKQDIRKKYVSGSDVNEPGKKQPLPLFPRKSKNVFVSDHGEIGGKEYKKPPATQKDEGL